MKLLVNICGLTKAPGLISSRVKYDNLLALLKTFDLSESKPYFSQPNLNWEDTSRFQSLKGKGCIKVVR